MGTSSESAADFCAALALAWLCRRCRRCCRDWRWRAELRKRRRALRRRPRCAAANGVCHDSERRESRAMVAEGRRQEVRACSTMEPLAALKDQIQVIAGLGSYQRHAGPDGAGDHARAKRIAADRLPGEEDVRRRIFELGTSIDQVAAQHIGHLTRFRSLELTCDTERAIRAAAIAGMRVPTNTTFRGGRRRRRCRPSRIRGSCSSGCSARGTPEERRKNMELRQQTSRSILDFVREDARSLGNRI